MNVNLPKNGDPIESANPSPGAVRPLLMFDEQDYELVDLVNEFRDHGKSRKPQAVRRLFDPSLHPRGIKELASTQARRIAYALIRLLDSLEVGDAKDRLTSLRALHEELLHGGQSTLILNTARVLLSIMKDLVREREDYWRQMELAHDFFSAVSGRPRVIRRFLRQYHLLEMSEAWNQVAFDHHVHDAHTKGRKSPTHLIMDAWIKGIRELTVVYYHYLVVDAVRELVEAGAIMGITVRPGVEVQAELRGKYVQFIWVPLGLDTVKDLVAYLEKPVVRAFFAAGQEVANRRSEAVLTLLESFNRRHLETICNKYNIQLPRLDVKDFLDFVGVGQPSLTHLADFIHSRVLEVSRARIDELRAERGGVVEDAESLAWAARLDQLQPDVLVEEYLQRAKNPEVPDPKVPVTDEHAGVTDLCPRELLDRLLSLRSGSRIILNPSNLDPVDVVQVLFEGRGAITHMEVFNLKDYKRGSNPHMARMAEVRRQVNRGNPVTLKRLLKELLVELDQEDGEDGLHRREAVKQVLDNLQQFISFYAQTPLHSQIGSDSVGRSHVLFGMGLAVADTLLPRARRAFDREPGTRQRLPVRTDVERHSVWRPRESAIGPIDAWWRLVRALPVVGDLGYLRLDSYEVLSNSTRMDPDGNILTLGGTLERRTNHLLERLRTHPVAAPSFRFGLMSSRLQHLFKVVVGFLPAFLTFFLTKDWWLLSWFGALIWFAITGLRNILQSVVGGGGIGRSKLLGWRDLVSWQRIADSLFFTGFSVPLLDWLVKSMLLDQGMGVNTATNPILLYTVMAVANGIYLLCHNTFRGLPRSAALGNFFRSVLSIPIAVGLNSLALEALCRSGFTPVEANDMLQRWAAVIGKLASDIVAGIIEGTADRSVNIHTREADYRSKISLLLHMHGRLEALFPQANVIEMLESPKEFVRTMDGEARDLEVVQIINALDLMYFWMRQPRARPVFRRLLAGLSEEERRIVLGTQRLLERRRLVSELFLDNLVGKNFSAPLAFYLDRSPAYLRDMARLQRRKDD